MYRRKKEDNKQNEDVIKKLELYLQKIDKLKKDERENK